MAKQTIKDIQKDKDLNTVNSIKSEEQSLTYDDHSSPVEKVTFIGLNDDGSIYSDESEDENSSSIPDGGWGWVVVAASFIISACADGLAFSFGLLHVEFTQYFETTQSQTSLIGSVFLATPLLAGPVMSALVDRFGCRLMTIIAGVMSTIGFLLAAVSDSIVMLCLTFGLLSGLSMGILYVTAVVSVAFWFDKKRNFALSLSSCGIGFGTLIYTPMTNYFLEVYDWRNTIVLLSGSLLNMCVCGALMADPEWLTVKQKREKSRSKSRSRRSSSMGSVSCRSVGESEFLTQDELKTLLKSGETPEYILSTLATKIAEAEKLEATTQMNAEQSSKRIHSYIHLPTFIQHNEKVPVEVIEKLMKNKLIYNVILENYPDVITRRKSEVNLNIDGPSADVSKLAVTVKAKKAKNITSAGRNDSHINQQHDFHPKIEEICNTTHAQTVPEKSTSFYQKLRQPSNRATFQQNTNCFAKFNTDQRYLRNMPLYKNTIMHRGAMLTLPKYKLRTSSSMPNIYRNSMWSVNSESDDEFKWYHRLWETLKSTFDFKMFTEFHFLMFSLSTLILSIWCIIPYFFLQSYMISIGEEGSPTMISIIGVASTIGIVALGWAGDQPWVNVTKTYTVCLVICGLSVASYPLVITSFWPLAVVSAIFGLSFASCFSYIPAILMELSPIENFTMAYGLVLLTEGIGHLAGPPIAGLLYDLTGTWELTFYMGGVWLIVSGLCVGVIAYTKNMRLCGSGPVIIITEESDANTDSENG